MAFVLGISHYEGELDFDFSSQESSDSELEADNVEVHATPANDQYARFMLHQPLIRIASHHFV